MKVVQTTGISLVLLIVYGSIAVLFQPEAVFVSSDGKWVDSELLWKGRTFEIISAQFSDYKASIPYEVVLYRTTPIRPYNIFAWPSYLSSEKWRLPYRKTQSLLSANNLETGYMRPLPTPAPQSKPNESGTEPTPNPDKPVSKDDDDEKMPSGVKTHPAGDEQE